MKVIIVLALIAFSVPITAQAFEKTCFVTHDSTGIPEWRALKICPTGSVIFGSGQPQAATAFIAEFCDYSKSITVVVDVKPRNQKVNFIGSVANYSCIYSGNRTWDAP